MDDFLTMMKNWKSILTRLRPRLRISLKIALIIDNMREGVGKFAGYEVATPAWLANDRGLNGGKDSTMST
jgi:hypothetical protein